MKRYFVYFDEVNVVLPFHKVKVLEENNDSYSLRDMPININGSLMEYQNRVGKFVYILDEFEDSKYIQSNPSFVNVLEGDNNKYNIVKLYDKNNIGVKGSKLGSTIIDPDKKFAIYKNTYKLLYSDEIYVLRQNNDGTVSIHSAPFFIRKSILQYQIENDCFLVVAYRDSLECDRDDIIELESLGDDNKYDIMKIYERGKVNVKKQKKSISKIN